MIFHVIAQHDHSTCNRVKEGPGFAKSGMTWVEGNDKVNILGVWGYPVSHRVFSVVEPIHSRMWNHCLIFILVWVLWKYFQ